MQHHATALMFFIFRSTEPGGPNSLTITAGQAGPNCLRPLAAEPGEPSGLMITAGQVAPNRQRPLAAGRKGPNRHRTDRLLVAELILEEAVAVGGLGGNQIGHDDDIVDVVLFDKILHAQIPEFPVVHRIDMAVVLA